MRVGLLIVLLLANIAFLGLVGLYLTKNNYISDGQHKSQPTGNQNYHNNDENGNQNKDGQNNNTSTTTTIDKGKNNNDDSENTLKPKRKRIAITVFFHKDEQIWLKEFAAVFSYSVRKIPTKYETDLIAFVTTNVTLNFATYLQAFGFKVIVKPVPIKYEEIGPTATDFYRTTFVDPHNGCCGPAELLKMYGLTLHQYHRVAVMDADMVKMLPSDELYEFDEGLVYTKTDWEPMCGNHWVVKPNQTHFDGLLNVLRQGDWRAGSAWEGTGIGWCYGGSTIQGVIPFYFQKKTEENNHRLVNGKFYNNFGWEIWANVTEQELKWAHFTGACQKPILCLETGYLGSKIDPMCTIATNYWWKIRAEFETKFGLKPTERCPRGGYQLINFPEAEFVTPNMFSIPQTYID